MVLIYDNHNRCLWKLLILISLVLSMLTKDKLIKGDIYTYVLFLEHLSPSPWFSLWLWLYRKSSMHLVFTYLSWSIGILFFVLSSLHNVQNGLLILSHSEVLKNNHDAAQEDTLFTYTRTSEGPRSTLHRTTSSYLFIFTFIKLFAFP